MRFGLHVFCLCISTHFSICLSARILIFRFSTRNGMVKMFTRANSCKEVLANSKCSAHVHRILFSPSCVFGSVASMAKRSASPIRDDSAKAARQDGSSQIPESPSKQSLLEPQQQDNEMSDDDSWGDWWNYANVIPSMAPPDEYDNDDVEDGMPHAAERWQWSERRQRWDGWADTSSWYSWECAPCWQSGWHNQERSGGQDETPTISRNDQHQTQVEITSKELEKLFKERVEKQEVVANRKALEKKTPKANAISCTSAHLRCCTHTPIKGAFDNVHLLLCRRPKLACATLARKTKRPNLCCNIKLPKNQTNRAGSANCELHT